MSKSKSIVPEVVESARLNEVITVVTKRPNKTVRIQQDFQYCPTMAEQHTSHLSDINYLMKRYQPDELAQYIAARNQYRQEILGHDFSQEPDLTHAKNIVYELRQRYENLPDDVRSHFKNHVEFLKFIDNPANQEKMIKLGLMTKKEIAEHTTEQTTRTQDAKDTKES